MIGVPLGRHEETQATVCCDPISWFQRARLISNPSAFILGKPGLGKSTLVRRMFLGLSAQGVHPLILGDLKGEHIKAVKALGGQVISLGRGVGYLNILDPGQAVEVAQLLEVNGHRFQNGSTKTMIFGVAQLVSYISRFMTLHPGDLITTGTPPGVGMGHKPQPVFLKPGDKMTLGISGLGEQSQTVHAWDPALIDN